MPSRIDSIVAESAFEELIRITEGLRKLNELIKESAKNHITIVSQNAPESVAALVAALEKLTQATENNRQRTEERRKEQDRSAKLEERLIYLASEKAKQEFELRARINDTSAAMRNAAKDANDIGGAYGRLSRQFTESALAAKNMVLELGKNHPQAQQAIKDANDLNNKLKDLDASVGQNNRNVGDYTRATAGLQRTFGQLASELPSLNNGLRTFASAISNNLAPFLNELRAVVVATRDARNAARDNAQQQGDAAKLAALAAGKNADLAKSIGETAKQQALANSEALKGGGVFKALGAALFSFNTFITIGVTLFTIYGPKLYAFITGNKEASETVKKLNEDMKSFNESLRDTSSRFTAQAAADVAQLKALASTAADTSRSMNERTEAVRQLIKLYPEYLSGLTQEDILSGKAAKSIRLVGQAITARAAAEANLQKAQDSARRVADIDEQIATASNKKLAAVKAYNDYVNGSRTKQGSLTARSLYGDITAADADLVNLRVARTQAQQQEVNSFNAAQAAQNRVRQSTAGVGPQGRTADVIERELADVNRLIRQYGAAFKNARGLLKDQREALETELDKFLGNKDRNKTKTKSGESAAFSRELKNDEDLTSAFYDELIIRANGEARQQKRTAENEKKTLNERLLAYDGFIASQLRSLYLSDAKQRKIVKDQLDEITRIEGKAVGKRTQSEKNLVERKAILQQQLANITADTAEKETDIIEISEKAQTDIVEREAKKRAEAEQKALENFRSVRTQRQPGSNNGRTQSREEFLQERQRALEFYSGNAVSAAESLFDIERARSAQRIDSINAEIDAINRKRDADIAAVESAFLTDKQRKEAIAQINARAAAEQQEQEDKMRKERRRSAELEKALGIAKIIVNTAVAVSAQLSIPGAGIGLAIATAAAGAAQLAAAIATPIPQFRTGKGKANKYEGLAVVGDGAPELIKRAGGGYEYIDKETIKYLKSEDQVLTGAETNELFKYYGVGMPMMRTKEGRDYAMDMLLQDHANQVVSAIERKRFPVQHEPAPWFQQWQTNRNK